ncbi:MT-A70-domain-containing protein [Westerdykella ornata]|uniref:MT-A70-domain-containing protein n=1 Tax=Westerdykella ornata TaxID=318751 RepID=A0A6A6JI52_WESOR|nr:MT-A70-domain-containing protein [Westerdykella ornata]KAF2276231.1 MT-A70-domain-containing protein [Westerdykella ornata]
MPSALQKPSRTAILFQNETCDVTLIDIPASIAIAQGRPDAIIRSTPALEEPFNNLPHEPKTKRAKEKLSIYASSPLHQEYKSIIEGALSRIHEHVNALPWCLPRTLVAQEPTRRNSDMEVDDPEDELDARLTQWSAAQSMGEANQSNLEKMMATLGTISEPDATLIQNTSHPWLMSYSPIHKHSGEPEAGEEVAQKEPWQSSFYNANNYPVYLTVYENVPHLSAASKYRFIVPSRSSLFLSDSTHSDAFRASFRELTAEYVLPRHFDFILLDPPWPSGSVKRKGNYEQVGGMPYMKKMLMSMDIDNYIEHNGLVGIWVTNKQSLRDHVLGPGGLFEQWNVGLIEEWIWIKTTIKGEPMFSLGSEWRKPYEVLLLGRAAPNSWTTMTAAPEIKRRVIAAVPDIHSRKPCLKELIEPFMPGPDYCALEIFARYLVAGWTSWGNEVLKFNWEEYWAPWAPGARSPSPYT